MRINAVKESYVFLLLVLLALFSLNTFGKDKKQSLFDQDHAISLAKK